MHTVTFDWVWISCFSFVTPNQLIWSRRCSTSWLIRVRRVFRKLWGSPMTLFMWKKPVEVHILSPISCMLIVKRWLNYLLDFPVTYLVSHKLSLYCLQVVCSWPWTALVKIFFCWLSIVFCSFSGDTPEEPWYDGTADQKTRKDLRNFPTSTKWQRPVCRKIIYILYFDMQQSTLLV